VTVLTLLSPPVPPCLTVVGHMGRNGGGWRDFVYAQIILGFIFCEAREVCTLVFW
jgi:hypothetical protein